MVCSRETECQPMLCYHRWCEKMWNGDKTKLTRISGFAFKADETLSLILLCCSGSSWRLRLERRSMVFDGWSGNDVVSAVKTLLMSSLFSSFKCHKWIIHQERWEVARSCQQEDKRLVIEVMFAAKLTWFIVLVSSSFSLLGCSRFLTVTNVTYKSKVFVVKSHFLYKKQFEIFSYCVCFLFFILGVQQKCSILLYRETRNHSKR